LISELGLTGATRTTKTEHNAIKRDKELQDKLLFTITSCLRWSPVSAFSSVTLSKGEKEKYSLAGKLAPSV
jgi:hypothetical protein